jgi:hypothetical protein
MVGFASSISMSQAFEFVSHKFDMAVVGFNDAQLCREWDTQAATLNVHLEILRSFEGESLTPYVPSDRSGPTIAQGLDLGNAGAKRVRAILEPIVSPHMLKEALSANGLRGDAARRWVARHPNFSITKCEQHQIAIRQYVQYMSVIEQSVPSFVDAPPEVRTVALSFVIHTGSVKPIKPSLASKNWKRLAERISTYHDSWEGPEAVAFQQRRRSEARVIDLQYEKRQEVVFD